MPEAEGSALGPRRSEAEAQWTRLDPAGPSRVVWVRTAGPRVVLLLGAFDPPTNAHIAVLRAAARAVDARGVLCVTRVVLDRGNDVLLGDAERLRILEVVAATEGFGLALANRGTYLDVARAVHADAVHGWFVIGSDKLSQLEDPSFYTDAGEVDATFREVAFLVVPRGGVEIERPDVSVLDAADVFDDDATAAITATEVRRRVRAGQPIDGLVPPVVAESLEGYTAAEPR